MLTWSRKAFASALACSLALAGGAAYMSFGAADVGDTKPLVTFSGGHGTDPKDGGRPIFWWRRPSA